ncbi:hypothetical protein ACHAPU_009943 [Fusarium lateritium]
MPAVTNWKTIAALHREKQIEAVPSEWLVPEKQLQALKSTGDKLIEAKVVQRSGLLTEKELDITERYTALELLDRLHRQHFTSEEVVVAFSKRASLAQQLTSCLTEILFEEGIARAKELDKQLQTTGKLAGPLHGLPISLKDSYVIRGHHATVGYTEFLRQPIPETNSALVDLLLDAGAVLYCKTNLPQTMMTADSENNIFGRTLNPHNTNLTDGGSTGGEVADILWRELKDIPEKRLVIGVMANDPEYPLHPPVRRALAKAASALEKAGHKMVHLSQDPKRNAGHGGRIGFQYFSMLGPDLDTVSREIGEPLVNSVARGAHPFSKGEFPVPPQLDVPERLARLNDMSFLLLERRRRLFPHDTYGVPVYTLMWNVLDFPAGIIPFGTASKFEDAEPVKAKAAFDPDYIPEATDGAPCAVQIIAPRFRDEECLQAMGIIDKAIRVTREQKL